MNLYLNLFFGLTRSWEVKQNVIKNLRLISIWTSLSLGWVSGNQLLLTARLGQPVLKETKVVFFILIFSSQSSQIQSLPILTRHVMSCPVTSHHILSLLVTSCYVLSIFVPSLHILSHPITSSHYPIMSHSVYPITSLRGLSCPSCPISFCSVPFCSILFLIVLSCPTPSLVLFSCYW